MEHSSCISHGVFKVCNTVKNAGPATSSGVVFKLNTIWPTEIPTHGFYYYLYEPIVKQISLPVRPDRIQIEYSPR